MTTTRRALAVAALGLLATAPEATAVLSEMAGGKQGTDIPREMLARARAVAVFPQVKKGAVIVGGRYAMPASARALANVLTTYSPLPRKR